MKKLLLVSLPLMLLLAACSTSKITGSYSYNQRITPAKKVLVLGLFNEKNDRAKKAMEKELAGDLNKFGYNAVTASDQFGNTAFRGLNETEALQKLRDEGIENVVTITLVNKDKQKRYVPSTYGYNPGFWGYYSYYSPWAYRPYPYYRQGGYTEEKTSYVFETNLYNVTDNQLMYSAESKTIDANSMATLADDYARSVVRDMKRKNVLG